MYFDAVNLLAITCLIVLAGISVNWEVEEVVTAGLEASAGLGVAAAFLGAEAAGAGGEGAAKGGKEAATGCNFFSLICL